MLEFIESLPLWALKALALGLGLGLALVLGLLLARWLRRLWAKLPPRE